MFRIHVEQWKMFVTGHPVNQYFYKFATSNAALAQLVEQLTRNEQVVGSSPMSGSDFSVKILTRNVLRLIFFTDTRHDGIMIGIIIPVRFKMFYLPAVIR